MGSALAALPWPTLSLRVAKAGWVFNPWLDFAVFYVPLGIAFLMQQISPGQALVIKASLSSNHVFMTLLPVLFTRDLQKRARMKSVAWQALLIVGVLFALSVVHFRAFQVLLGYYAIWHIVAQWNGLRKYIGKALPPQPVFWRRWESGLFWLSVFGPLAFWHTELSSIEKSYFYKDNLILRPGATTAIVLLSLMALAAIVWLGRIFYLHRVGKASPQLGVLSFFGAVWCVFFVAIVVADNRGFFFWSLILTHGMSYVAHIMLFPSRGHANSFYPTWNDRPWFAGLFYVSTAPLAVLWLLAFHWWSKDSMLAVLLWSPLLIHYVFDTRIWRR